MKKYIILLLSMAFFLTNCKKNDDPVVVKEQEQQEEQQQEESKKLEDYPVQDFMWQTMNAYYFWQGDVADLADTRFPGLEDVSYVEFLGSQSNPADFYYTICNKHENIVGEAAAIDRFSFHSENYKDLVQLFQGVSKSNGLEFGLGLYGDKDDVFGFVHYVIPNSDASQKEIKRGDIFLGVNGQDLNLDNYIDLLFGDSDTYTLNMADIIDRTITANDKEVQLTQEEGLVENPILISKVLEVEGQKIGYLMYNSFVADFDDELNEKFGEFASAGINDLILDFRYNGGGRVSSAVQIASSVYGTKTDELFLKARYNNKLQAELSDEFLVNNFTDKTFDSGTPLNSLGLNRVFVIATDRTASASELVMNGLAPYVEVVHVGTKTVGKNEFSNTFVDDPENGNFYNPDREGNINPKNQWAIQPLLGRNENADGFSDYTTGLVPDHELDEDVASLGVLGETSDPLLQKTLDAISGLSSKRDFRPMFPVDYVGDSKMFKPTSGVMLMDGLMENHYRASKSQE